MRDLVLAAWLLLACGGAWAGDWPQWRGPFCNGSAEEKGLPATWGPTQNRLWTAPLPGPSAATPAVWKDRVFVSSTDDRSSDLLALCLSARDGRLLWQKKAGAATVRAPSNTMASPSPVTDGRRAYFLYGTGELAAFDMAGSPLWSRRLGEEFGRFSLKYGYSSSPLLYGGHLYVQVLRASRPYSWSGTGEWATDSFLLCLDGATGKDVWRQQHDTEARDESKDAYTTPVLYQDGKRSEIVMVGGDRLCGHNPQTGAEIWHVDYNPRRERMWRLIPSAVPGDGLIYAVVPRGGNPLFATWAGRNGEVLWPDLAWTYNTFTPDVCVPLLYGGRLFVLAEGRRTLTCLDAKTGREIWQSEMDRDAVYRASPTGADGKVYLISEKGDATVLAAGDRFEVLARVTMGDGPVSSSIAAAGGRLFVRTAHALHCIGSK